MNPSTSVDWEHNWYCVRAKPRSENAAAQSIKAIQGVDVFFPKTIPQRKKNATPAQALFPGYLFACFDPILNMRAVHFAHGVAYVLRRNLKPDPVDPEIIKDLRIATTVDGLLEIPDRPHQVGSEVNIIEGLFKDGKGMVTRLIPARDRVKVLLEFLGRPTEIEIDENSLDFPKAHPMRVS